MSKPGRTVLVVASRTRSIMVSGEFLMLLAFHNNRFSSVTTAGLRATGQRQTGLESTYGVEDRSLSRDSGVTLVELVIAITVLAIIATASLPVAKFQVKRQKERELRADLWEMRDAIDQYKDTADRGAFQVKADSFNYPPDLQTLVDGVEVMTTKMKFLRAIPVDPMTGSTDWDFRSNQDDADASSWGGQNVFDVHSKSTATALDGTKYNTW